MTSSQTARPPAQAAGRFRWLVLAIVIMAIAIALLWALKRGTRETFTGHLRANSTAVIATSFGRISRIISEEGATVEVGQPLVIVADTARESRLGDLRQEVANAQTDLDRARARAEVEIAWKRKDLEADLLAARLQAAAIVKNQFDQQLQAHAWEKLLGEERSPTADVDGPDNVFRSIVLDESDTGERRVRAMLQRAAADNAAEVSTVQLKLCEDRTRSLEQLLAELPEKIHGAEGIAAAEARLANANEALQALTDRDPSIEITASAAGTVGIFRRKLGDRIADGEPIVDILDERQLYVTVRIPAGKLFGVSQGTEVTLAFPGHENCIGQVREIPTQTVATDERDYIAENCETRIALNIEPTGTPWPKVPIGTALEVTIHR